MAYSALPTKAAGDTLDLSDYNAIKGNFEAGVPDVYTTKGDIVSASAANAAVRLGVGADDSILVADSSQTGNLAWQIQPAARVYNDANIDPAANTWVTLTFNQERYDTDALHSTSTNTGRLTIPANGGGLYHIGGNVRFDTSGLSTGEGIEGIRILLNGTTVIGQTLTVVGMGREFDHSRNIAVDYELAAADFLELQVYTYSDVDVLAESNFSPEFWCHWFRRA